jgi:cell division protein FtsB
MEIPLHKIFQSFIKNKYLISLVGFFIWIAVLDSYSWYDRIQLEKNLKNLKAEKAFLEKKIKQDSINLHDLKTNKSNLEKFAREKYLMKKENEDVFVIVSKSEE